VAGEQPGRSQRSRACVLEVTVSRKQLSITKSNRPTSPFKVVSGCPHLKQLTFALKFLWQWNGHSRNTERCWLAVNFENDRFDFRPMHEEISRRLYRDLTDTRLILLVLKVYGKVANASPILCARDEAESFAVEVPARTLEQVIGDLVLPKVES
jgi:hypothetical protein